MENISSRRRESRVSSSFHRAKKKKTRNQRRWWNGDERATTWTRVKEEREERERERESSTFFSTRFRRLFPPSREKLSGNWWRDVPRRWGGGGGRRFLVGKSGRNLEKRVIRESLGVRRALDQSENFRLGQLPAIILMKMAAREPDLRASVSNRNGSPVWSGGKKNSTSLGHSRIPFPRGLIFVVFFHFFCSPRLFFEGSSRIIRKPSKY